MDGFFEGTGSSGGFWKDRARFEVYASEKEGSTYRSWFNKRKTVKGVYTNGDGEYWKDNWLNNYEGRIYKGQGTGHEWWAMNIQRYASYHLRKKGERLAALLDSGKLSSDEVGEFFNIMSAGLRSEQSSNFVRAQKMYPELSEFIESKFGKRTMIYTD